MEEGKRRMGRREGDGEGKGGEERRETVGRRGGVGWRGEKEKGKGGEEGREMRRKR